MRTKYKLVVEDLIKKMIYMHTKLKRVGGSGGQHINRPKKMSTGAIHKSTRGRPCSHTIIEQEINTRPEKREKKAK